LHPTIAAQVTVAHRGGGHAVRGVAAPIREQAFDARKKGGSRPPLNHP